MVPHFGANLQEGGGMEEMTRARGPPRARTQFSGGPLRNAFLLLQACATQLNLYLEGVWTSVPLSRRGGRALGGGAGGGGGSWRGQGDPK